MSSYENGPANYNDLAEPENDTAQNANPTENALVRPDRPQHRRPQLRWGSDVEIAGLIKAELTRDYGMVPYCEGEFWRYTVTHWEPFPSDELHRRVHRYDGLQCTCWPYNRVKLGKGRIESVLSILATLASDEIFFEARPVGINCLSGFISFENGKPILLSHAREHRQRHVIPGRWRPEVPNEIPEGCLLGQLLRGSFEGDDDADDKISLLGEIAGAAALGHGPRHKAPKAIILLGRTAENGKSQILDLLRGLLPASAVSSVPPSKFEDDRHIVKLVGKLLNTSDELGTAKAIASDRFKAIITGEPSTGRDVYRPSIHFRPLAQHVFACNQLPSFHGGMDRGVLRRLMVVPFNRTIPADKRIPHIGQRIVQEELDRVLAWAVQGAERLLRRKAFPQLLSSEEALQEWAQGADPVLGWIEDRVNATTLAAVGEGPPRVTSRKAYDDFKSWAENEGYSPNGLPSVNTFVQRLRAAGPGKGIAYKHSGKFRGFEGMRLKPSRVAALAEKIGRSVNSD